MLNDILIWGALLVALVLAVIRCSIGALTLAYFLDLSLGHVPGLLGYLNPNMWVGDGEATKVGFDMTLIGMTTFIVGAMASIILSRVRRSKQTTPGNNFSQLGWRLIATGIGSYFLLLPVSALVPSLAAVASALGTLLTLGFWVRLYATTGAHNRPATLWIVASLPLLPLATLVTGGFIGFGTIWCLSIIVFWFVIARRRIWFYLATPVVIFLGLSLFVTYFQQRGDIREVVWDESTGIVRRLERVSSLVTDFQFLDLSDVDHLNALDLRLNQNFLVGRGVMRHREGLSELWYGTTVPVWALIPRAIWPDKPSVGGGQDLVEEFTGIEFEKGTSVGTGAVLEFYMNFGTPGVVIGFAVLGFILMRLDQALMRALAMRNIDAVVKITMPGLALLSPLGNFLEVVVAVATAIIASQFLVRSSVLGSPHTLKPNAKLSGQTMRVIGRR